MDRPFRLVANLFRLLLPLPSLCFMIGVSAHAIENGARLESLEVPQGAELYFNRDIEIPDALPRYSPDPLIPDMSVIHIDSRSAITDLYFQGGKLVKPPKYEADAMKFEQQELKIGEPFCQMHLKGFESRRFQTPPFWNARLSEADPSWWKIRVSERDRKLYSLKLSRVEWSGASRNVMRFLVSDSPYVDDISCMIQGDKTRQLQPKDVLSALGDYFEQVPEEKLVLWMGAQNGIVDVAASGASDAGRITNDQARPPEFSVPAASGAQGAKPASRSTEAH